MPLKLSWDGSDLGDITKYFVDICEPELDTVGSRLRLRTKQGKVECLAWRYKNDVPLVIDELKPVFGLNKIGRHKCKIKGTKLLLAKFTHIRENATEGNNEDIETIRLHIVFRHLFGLITRGEFLWYRPGEGVISYKELTITFSRESSIISEVNIKRWFDNNRANVITTVKKLISSHIPQDSNSLIKAVQIIRMEVDKVVRRINPEMIEIVTGFMSRMQIYLTYMACCD